VVVYPRRWWCILVGGGVSSSVVVFLVGGGVSSSVVVFLVGGGPAAYYSRTTTEGTRKAHQCGGAHRRNPRFQGIKTKGYCSMYQLFKLSSWVALYKRFISGNLIKTLFSIDYRGYFIIQAIHPTINYLHFLHKTNKDV
jgi:hypothetical protein